MFRVLFGLCMTGLVLGQCPHQRTSLKRWSADATWGVAGKPQAGETVEITEGILVDEIPPALHDINIQSSGSLVFDPATSLVLRAHNIHVSGSLEIGSEDCQYTGQLKIVITGNRESHVGEPQAKSILVMEGGTLEIHGSPKLSWTKLEGTLIPSKDRDIFFEHARIPENVEHNSWVRGVVAYTFNTSGEEPTVKQFGAYDIHWHFNDLLAHIQGVEDGDVFMMASCRYIRIPETSKNVPKIYDALETLIHGEVTGDSVLRTVDDSGETYAMIFQKGNAQSLQEMKNPLGTGSQARLQTGGMVYLAETEGHTNYYLQVDNFRVGTYDQIYPKIRLVDDATTWIPGDKIVFASTDYDMMQAEEATIVVCQETDCATNEVRFDANIKYTHFGEILAGAVDMRAEVGMLTRSVVIEGEVESECPAFNGNCGERHVRKLDTFGAHVKVLKGYANVRIENAELRNVGQQTDVGRYPIHFHMCFDKIESAAQPYVKGCAIHNTFARCLTIHGSHGVLIQDNFCYNHMGHGYFLEDGGEKYNTFDGNLAISTRKGTGKLEPMDSFRPASFWITNPLVHFKNNVAAGGEGTGIWFLFPEEPLPPSRDFKMMEKDEAKRTGFLSFHNNVGHSNVAFGIIIGSVLTDSRGIHCCNKWQPRANTSDPDSEALNIPLDKITCYKNRFNNLWIEGGLLDVTHVSVSDSLNGMIISNEGQQGGYGGKVSHSAVIGESVNVGVPTEGFTRSIPYYWDTDAVQSGVTMWKGPTKFSHMWFDGFQTNDQYDVAAIAKKRDSPYFFSILNSFKDTVFAFDDAPGEGRITISGTTDLKGWEKSRDGEMIAGYTFYDENGDKTFVVKPDPFSSAGSDCVLRPHWRMATCTAKYGNLRVTGDFEDRTAVFVRDDYPAAQLEFEMHSDTGPQVVVDGGTTYTVHFPATIPSWIKFTVPGLDKGDKLRVGVCTPIGATLEFQSLHPHSRLSFRSRFTEVHSLAELDADDADEDGKKYYYDNSTGMVYYKFVNSETRDPAEYNTCNNRRCPEFRIKVLSDNLGGADCRDRIYTATQLSSSPPALSENNAKILATGSNTPPAGYGAGSTRPFPANGASPVDGGFSDWSEWTECSKTCGAGEQMRTRQCNNPMPKFGGADCEGDRLQTQSCVVVECPINGEFSAWGEWSDCVALEPGNPDTCSGMSSRTRSCNNPATQYGGEYCEGEIEQVKPCTVC